MKTFDTKTYLKLAGKVRDNFQEWIVVHHSGGTDANPLADTSNHTASIIESWHLSQGWEGIGYHFVIHKDGAVYRGRPEHYHGAHTPAVNSKSIGICLCGNFDATLPTKEQTDSLRALLKELSTKYSIPKEKIIPHRHFQNKTCYGKNLSDSWARSLLDPEPVKATQYDQLAACHDEVEEYKSKFGRLVEFIKKL